MSNMKTLTRQEYLEKMFLPFLAAFFKTKKAEERYGYLIDSMFAEMGGRQSVNWTIKEHGFDSYRGTLAYRLVHTDYYKETLVDEEYWFNKNHYVWLKNHADKIMPVILQVEARIFSGQGVDDLINELEEERRAIYA